MTGTGAIDVASDAAAGFDRTGMVAAITAHNADRGRWPIDNDPSARFPIYTRANIGEVFPSVVWPFAWTLWGIPYAETGWRQALANLGAFDLDEFTPNAMEMLGVFGGYGYLNVSASRVFGARTPGLSAQAIDASFFGEQPEVPPYAARPSDTSPVHAERLGAMLQQLFTATDLPELREMRAAVEQIRTERPGLATLSDAALLARTRTLAAAQWERLWVRHIMATYHATVPSGVIAGICAAVRRAELAADIMGATGDIDSALPTAALWTLGRRVHADAALGRLFDAGLDGLTERLATDAPAFAAAYAAFLRDFGFRGPQEWEMRSGTWELMPAAPLAAIDRMRFAADADAPEARMAARRRARSAAIDTVRALLGAAPEAEQFDAAVSVAGLYFAARERTKTTCAMLVHEMRMPMWELGRRFVERGVFATADQFALLTNAEWDEALTDPAGAGTLVQAREADAARLAALTPPFIVDAVVPPLGAWQRRDDGSTTRARVGDVLRGQPGCAGIARGIVRVVHDAADPGELGPGDVLVASHTDPSWTPLFAAASAVVVNVGATVSHAVVVARELGVPCAVSVTGATARLPDGATVEVDGGAGTVTVLALP